MKDSELQGLLRTSPRDGHRAVFEQYVHYVYTIVWSKLRGCGTPEDAEEVVSDVFAEVFRYLDTEMVGNLQGFIAAVAKNRAINAYRSLKHRAALLPLEDAEALADDADVEGETEANAQRRLLLDQIAALGSPDAEIVFARYFYGRNAVEIARTVGMTPAAVRKRLSRAVKKLRTSLEAAGFGK